VGKTLVILCASTFVAEAVAQSQKRIQETTPSVSVTAKAPPPYHDPYTYFPADALLKSSTSGNVYHNDFFGFSYSLPQGWTAEGAQAVNKRNLGVTVRAEPAGEPLTSETLKILGPVALFNATPAGLVNRGRPAVPFVMITADLAVGPLTLDSVKESLRSTEPARQNHGIRLLSEPVEMTINDHVFIRKDFHGAEWGSAVWQTFVQTSVHGGLLTIRLGANSKAELDQLVATLQSLVFDAPPSSLVTVSSQPPFDRLELLAFAAVTFYPPYVTQVIRQRGANFRPDSTFLSAVRSTVSDTDMLNAVNNLRPKGATARSSEHDRAYDIVLRALKEMQGRQLVSAGDDFQLALQLVPNSATLHLAYAMNLLLLENYAQAEVQDRRSLELWPDDADAHVSLASALGGQNRDAEAIPEVREALRIFPKHKAAAVQLGFSLTRTRQFNEAIPVLREAISRTPEMPLLHKHLGLSLFQTGDTDGAIEELTIFLKVSPDDAEAHYDLGAAFRSKGRQSEAQAQFREAARLEPNNPLYAAAAEPEGPQQAAPSPGASPDTGSVSGNVYTNHFFGFSFEFPKGWTAMSADAARSMVTLGGALLANGDPMVQDATHAAARNSYPLLLVMEGTTKSHTLSTRSIQVLALHLHMVPTLKTADDLVKSMATTVNAMGTPVEIVGKPEEFPIGGRNFWKMNLTIRMNNGLRHASEIVTLDKGYLLLFIFSSPDAADLEEIIATINSVRFSETAN
jgi:Flp pilus assembly protein TadD